MKNMLAVAFSLIVFSSFAYGAGNYTPRTDRQFAVKDFVISTANKKFAQTCAGEYEACGQSANGLSCCAGLSCNFFVDNRTYACE